MTPKLQIRFQKLSKPITDTIKKETIIWVIVIPIQSNFSLKNLPLFPQSSSFLLRNLLHFLQYSFLLHLFLLVKIHMYISLRSLLFVPGLLFEFTNLRAIEKPIENLRKVLEATKICRGLEIESQGFRVRFVKPKRRDVKPFFIRLSSASHTSKIKYQFQGGQRVIGPSQVQPLDQIIRQCIGHHVVEEVETRVPGG